MNTTQIMAINQMNQTNLQANLLAATQANQANLLVAASTNAQQTPVCHSEHEAVFLSVFAVVIGLMMMFCLYAMYSVVKQSEKGGVK